MSEASSVGMSEPPRMVQGRAHLTQVDATKGLVLFPSPEFSPWPPFLGWAETTSRQSAASNPHPHEREEVVNYVLSGALLHVDDAQRVTELPEGSVHMLSTVAERTHDLRSKPGTEARWVACVLHLPPHTPEPREPYRLGSVLLRPDLRSVVAWRPVVGARAPVQSAMDLEMWDLMFPGPLDLEAPIGDHRRAVAYVVDGSVKAEGRVLGPGEAVLLSGYPTLTLSAREESRMLLASVPVAR